MSIFDIKGAQIEVGGSGGETHKSDKFALRQGIVIAQYAHHGEGDFKLKFAARRKRSFINKAGRMTRVIGSGNWNLAAAKGRLESYAVKRVHQKGDHKILPGEYHIEAEAQAGWRCRIIQPELGQGMAMLPETEIDGDGESGESFYIQGPYTSGARPVVAAIRHYGIGGFSACAYSVDGTHQCVIYREQGQFYLQDIQTGIMPGKEYLLFINSPGGWSMAFSEGY